MFQILILLFHFMYGVHASLQPSPSGSGENRVIKIWQTTIGDKIRDNPGQLVVVLYSMNGCEPCRVMSPIYDSMPRRYPGVKFFKAPQEQCLDIRNRNIFAFPTTEFWANNILLYKHAGLLTEENLVRIIDEYNQGNWADTYATAANTYLNLSGFYDLPNCDAFNIGGLEKGKVKEFYVRGTQPIISDVEDQLILAIRFKQEVAIKHIFITSRVKEQSPKSVKVYLNRDYMDFTSTDLQEIVTETFDDEAFEKNQQREIRILGPKFSHFTKPTTSIHFLVESEGRESTRIDGITLYGVPVGEPVLNLSSPFVRKEKYRS